VAPSVRQAESDLSTLGTESDVGDGRPGWNPEPGAPLVPALLAWDRFTVGHHRETWLCWSVDLWAPAVVKIVRPEWKPQYTEALDREVRALTHLSHPAVPRLLLDGRDSALPYIALEYLDGPDLDEGVDAGGPFPAGDVARLGVLLLGALRALHAAGHAHLDIKPQNVLLVAGRPRLIDLGASRPLWSQLRPGEKLGTEGYHPPELAGCPAADVTPELDVYSLGATLVEVLDRTSVGADEVVDRLTALTDPDPARRPSTGAAMASLARAAGSKLTRPWPGFGERHLPPAPRRRRARRTGLTSVAAG
jgi:serine/threonine protein kinase